MDEVDSIGSARIDSGGGSGDSEVQRTMLELLNQLDGFESTKNIKVIMATNRIGILLKLLLFIIINIINFLLFVYLLDLFMVYYY